MIKTISSLLALALPLTAQDTKPKSYKFELIDLQRADSWGSYLVPVTISGETKPFLLDTGSAYSIAASKIFADQIKAPLTKSSQANAIGGSINTYTANFGNITLGKKLTYKFKQTTVLDFPKTPTVTIDKKSVEAHGFIGAQTLYAISAVIDTDSKQLLVPPAGTPRNLYRDNLKKRGATIVQLEKGPYAYPLIPITIKGKTFKFLIDSGATVNLIEPTVAKQLNLKLSENKNTLGGAGKSTSQVSTTTVEFPILGKTAKLPDLKFHVHPSNTKNTLPDTTQYGGILGAKTITAIRGKIDLGSYSLIIPSPK